MHIRGSAIFAATILALAIGALVAPFFGDGRWAQGVGSTIQTSAGGRVENRNERVKWALRRLYYPGDLRELGATDIRKDGVDFGPVQVTHSMYEIRASGFDGATVRMRRDGRVWVMHSSGL